MVLARFCWRPPTHPGCTLPSVPIPTMEPVDIQRDSLLRTRQAAQERAAPLARAVLVARYSLEKEALTEAAAEWLGAGGTSAGRACTGAFLFFDGSGYSKVVLVVLEGSSRDVEAFLGGAIAARLQDARVLCVSDDLAKRAWPAVFFTVGRPPVPTLAGA